MRVILGLILLTIFLNGILAQDPCTINPNNTDCDACTAAGCGWCAPTQQCLSGSKAGPNNGTCIGDSWEFGKCTPCGAFTDCRSCAAHDTDCFWCSKGTGTCYPIGFVGCTWSKECPCDVYESCTECTNDLGCQWCSDATSCVSVNSNCTAGEPVYNYTTGCPCGANHDCPNCLQTDGCNWCKGGSCSQNCNGQNSNNCQVYCNNVANTCDECVAMPGCAWCGLTRECVDATTSSCPYVYSCAVCSAASYCDTCLSMGADCIWCEDTKACSPVNTQCLTTLSCSNYCNTYTTCDDCSGARGCGWCDDTQVCADISTTMCFYTHSCAPDPTPIPPNKKCGFNGGSFVGGMFLVIGVLVLLVGAYLFLRWKTGKKFDYRELH